MKDLSNVTPLMFLSIHQLLHLIFNPLKQKISILPKYVVEFLFEPRAGNL